MFGCYLVDESSTIISKTANLSTVFLLRNSVPASCMAGEFANFTFKSLSPQNLLTISASAKHGKQKGEQANRNQSESMEKVRGWIAIRVSNKLVEAQSLDVI